MIQGPRPARTSELPAVVALSNAVFGGFDMGRAFPTLFSKDNAQNLFVFVDEGSPVALAGVTIEELVIRSAVVRAACVGSVCTLASHRGQGLAARLVDACLAAAAAHGASVVLVSGGRGLYRRVGCIDAGLFRVFRELRGERRGASPAVPDGAVDIREWTESDLADLHALHEREPVRFRRSPAVMETLLRSGAVHSSAGQTWVVALHGQAAGYVCISDSTVREYAGDRASILAAVPLVLERTGAESLELEAPASDAEMSRCAAARGMASRATGMDGTLRITDPKAFFTSVTPLLPRAVSVECGQTVVFRSGAKSMEVRAGAELAALVFGSVELTAPPGPLEEMLPFPLPLPSYGLNYI